MLEYMQSRVTITTDTAAFDVPCDSDDVLVVGLSEERGSGAICLTITHRPTGRKLGPALPADKYGFGQAKKCRDRLLACGVEWTRVEPGNTDLDEIEKRAVADVYEAMAAYNEHRRQEWLR